MGPKIKGKKVSCQVSCMCEKIGIHALKIKLKQACIGHSRHVTMQRVKLLVEVTVPRCVAEVMHKMLHPCPEVLSDRQRGRNNTEHKFIQSGNKKRKEKGKRQEDKEKRR